MTSDYPIETVNPYFKNRRLSIMVLHLFTGFLLLNIFSEWHALKSESAVPWLVFVLGVGEMAYALLAFRWLKGAHMAGVLIRLLAALVFFVYGVGLWQRGHPAIAACMLAVALFSLLVALLENRWKRPFIIRLAEEGVWFPRLFRDELLRWNRLNRVILRDDVLTLDFKNNRVVQLMTRTNYSGEQQDELNGFAASRTGAPPRPEKDSGR
ncbi:hypothetical protein [Compostibacter hankyongensis]|uniref:Uncharacterized protein n=1 Tax=Compostibacter hankyongensis TaxID=1007089 RepID=A0ABP8FPC8_9BACT